MNGRAMKMGPMHWNPFARDDHSISTTFILVVDDDAQVLASLARILKKAGFEPILAANGKEAIQQLSTHSFAAILSDINMPLMSGMDFLRKVRKYDLDVPVLLITGDPSIKTAAEAIEFGAFLYLVKPIDPRELTDCVRRAVRMHKMARLKRSALETLGNDNTLLLGDRAGLEVRFNHAMETLWMALQPIVSYASKKTYAFEALVRSDEETLLCPSALLLAAEKLDRMNEFSQLTRKLTAELVSKQSPGMRIFINLHSLDLNDNHLYLENAPLSRVAKQVVLEITERESLDDVKNLPARVANLRGMGFQIAIDDLGAGYAGLNSFTLLDPEVIKLDMSLIRGIDRDVKKQSIVRSLTKLSKELGMIVIAEGVETIYERDMVLSMGCDLLQGFLFAKPAKEFQKPRFGFRM